MTNKKPRGESSDFRQQHGWEATQTSLPHTADVCRQKTLFFLCLCHEIKCWLERACSISVRSALCCSVRLFCTAGVMMCYIPWPHTHRPAAFSWRAQASWLLDKFNPANETKRSGNCPFNSFLFLKFPFNWFYFMLVGFSPLQSCLKMCEFFFHRCHL